MDNNSTDGTRQEVELFADRSRLNIRYIFEGQGGKSFALNTGIKEARGEIIAFTDDDVLVATEWLKEMAGMFTNFDCIGTGGRNTPIWNGVVRPNWLVTAGPYRLSPGPTYEFDFGDEPRQLSLSEVPWGMNMAFKRSAFKKYGFFRTDLGPSGAERVLGEDTEFSRRLMRAGEKVMYSPGAVVFHPIDPKRITRSYFLSFYLNMGRAAIREEGHFLKAVLYFGVPRYMFRSLAENWVKWLTAVGSAKRFHCKTQLYFSWGEIVESRALQNTRIHQRVGKVTSAIDGSPTAE